MKYLALLCCFVSVSVYCMDNTTLLYDNVCALLKNNSEMIDKYPYIALNVAIYIDHYKKVLQVKGNSDQFVSKVDFSLILNSALIDNNIQQDRYYIAMTRVLFLFKNLDSYAIYQECNFNKQQNNDGSCDILFYSDTHPSGKEIPLANNLEY